MKKQLMTGLFTVLALTAGAQTFQESVSYTHLDVYKRQLLFWNQLAGIVHTQFKSSPFLIMRL